MPFGIVSNAERKMFRLRVGRQIAIGGATNITELRAQNVNDKRMRVIFSLGWYNLLMSNRLRCLLPCN